MSTYRCTSILLTFATLVVLPHETRAHQDTTRRITFTPGIRVQVRDAYDNHDAFNDVFVARTRLKGKGGLFGVARYYGELKIDNVERAGREATIEIENAWVEMPFNPALVVRIGLYDAVLSRNALTSDGKLLLMDRSLVKDALTSIGLADNAAGLLVHGRPRGGHLEYAAGLFDNLKLRKAGMSTTPWTDGPMVMGRVVLHLLDPAPSGGYGDYQSSYIGQGRRLSIGANSGRLSRVRAGDDDVAITAWGADLFFNANAFTLEAEHDAFVQRRSVRRDITGDGWYVQGGYLVHRRLELVTRVQELDSGDTEVASGNRLRWSSVGFNAYIQGHAVKLQGEYTFKRERMSALRNDAVQLQVQLEF